MIRRSRQAEQSSALTTVLAELPKLTAAELAEVRQRITFLRTLSGDGPVDVGEQIVIDAIHIVLRENGLGASTEQVTKSNVHASFLEKLPALHEFLAMASSNRNHQRAVLQIGVELLYKHLTDLGIPVGVRALMAHIHRVPEFINAAFPGYVRAGLTPWIIHAVERRQKTR
jgi:hypothetical protein